jgi:hypothetical protein
LRLLVCAVRALEEHVTRERTALLETNGRFLEARFAQPLDYAPGLSQSS